MQKLAEICIRRPVFAAVISTVIVLVGLVAMLALPVARYPEIAPPTITVRAFYPGADARTVADTVAAPIEQEVNGVEGMIYMSSVSANDGSMALTVTFEPGAIAFDEASREAAVSARPLLVCLVAGDLQDSC